VGNTLGGVVLRRVLLAIGVVALIACGAAAARPAAPTVTVTADAPIFTGKWRQSWYGQQFAPRTLRVTKKATITVTGTVDTAATLEVTLRSISKPSPPTATAQVAVANPGSWRLTTNMPVRPLPGSYRLTVSQVTSAGTRVLKATRDLVMRAPPEGVVSEAITSATKNGPDQAVLHSPYLAYARFHFRALPANTRRVGIQWRSPNNEKICQTPKGPLGHDCYLFVKIPANGWIHTFLRSRGTKLARGNWFCQLQAGSRIARRAFVRLR
jgi:hypothetical protein